MSLTNPWTILLTISTLSRKEIIVGNNERNRHSELISNCKETLFDKKARGICKDSLVRKLMVTYFPAGSQDRESERTEVAVFLPHSYFSPKAKPIIYCTPGVIRIYPAWRTRQQLGVEVLLMQSQWEWEGSRKENAAFVYPHAALKSCMFLPCFLTSRFQMS